MIINLDDVFFFTLGDKDYYEPGDRRAIVTSDFVDRTLRCLPQDWRHFRAGFWYQCNPPRVRGREHGWKIHVSATPSTASAILSIAVRIFIRHAVGFKFAADRVFMRWASGKRWGRGGSGKFITAYPADEAECFTLMEELRSALIGYDGPYILSDRRYRDCSVLYYRYGGFANIERPLVDGRMAKVLQLEGGATISDQRGPAFQLPPGIADPFIARYPPPPDTGEPGTLCEGRYRVQRALAYTNVGGVFEALDARTGRRVLIKEARPHTGESEDGRDAVHNLRKEHRLLSLLEDAEVAPKPLDFFKDWEHFYLVEEFVEGEVLRMFMSTRTIVLRTTATRAEIAEFFALYRSVYARIAEAMQALHDRGIIFGDVSHHNVIVARDGRSLRFIDFEGAFEAGIDVFPQLATQGFSSPQLRSGQTAEVADDVYGFGGLMFAGIFPMLDFTVIDPRSHERFLSIWMRDFGLPEPIARLIRRLMHPEREMRPTLAEAQRVLEASPPPREASIGSREAEESDLSSIVDRSAAFIESTLTPARTDRLVPGSPEVFTSHPSSVAFGASGVAYALHRITGRAREDMLDWIVARPLTHLTCAPGFYLGAAGIAWVLLELGRREEAMRALHVSRTHPLRWDDPDLFFGATGVGLTHLSFFAQLGDPAYLDEAMKVGEFLTRSRLEDTSGCWWTKDGKEHCGLGHGGAGIALFLLYLALASGEERFLDTGRAAMRRVLSRGMPTPDGGLAWRITEGRATVMPCWRWGTSGVGMVALRYRQVLGGDEYDRALEGICIDTDRKFSIFPSMQLGLAGWGEFHLDCIQLGYDVERARERAKRVIAGIVPYRIERGDLLAFPGETRTKISCDFATGGAGIALHLHRYLNGGEAAFMIDSLLGNRPASRVPAAEDALMPESVHASGEVMISA